MRQFANPAQNQPVDISEEFTKQENQIARKAAKARWDKKRRDEESCSALLSCTVPGCVSLITLRVQRGPLR